MYNHFVPFGLAVEFIIKLPEKLRFYFRTCNVLSFDLIFAEQKKMRWSMGLNKRSDKETSNCVANFELGAF